MDIFMVMGVCMLPYGLPGACIATTTGRVEAWGFYNPSRWLPVIRSQEDLGTCKEERRGGWEYVNSTLLSWRGGLRFSEVGRLLAGAVRSASKLAAYVFRLAYQSRIKAGLVRAGVATDLKGYAGLCWVGCLRTGYGQKPSEGNTQNDLPKSRLRHRVGAAIREGRCSGASMRGFRPGGRRSR
jgi:hypothetical protein